LVLLVALNSLPKIPPVVGGPFPDYVAQPVTTMAQAVRFAVGELGSLFLPLQGLRPHPEFVLAGQSGKFPPKAAVSKTRLPY
jgi:hypothetical protein